RPRKSCMSCGVFWTSTRGETDEPLRELDFAGDLADARVDVVALPVARGGAGGAVRRGGSGLPKRIGALRAGGERAGIDDGIASGHIHVAAGARESGRTDWGGRSLDVGETVHPTRDRAARLPRPCRRVPGWTVDGNVVAGGGVVPGRALAKPEDGGWADSNRKNA